MSCPAAFPLRYFPDCHSLSKYPPYQISDLLRTTLFKQDMLRFMSCWVFYTDKYTIQAFSFPHIRTAQYAFCNPSCLACFSCSCSYDCSYSGFQPRLVCGSQAGCQPRRDRGSQAGCQSSLECGSRWCCLMSRACNPKAWIIQQILSTGLLFFPPGDDLLICP